jgi:hypothetical protein
MLGDVVLEFRVRLTCQNPGCFNRPRHHQELIRGDGSYEGIQFSDRINVNLHRRLPGSE